MLKIIADHARYNVTMTIPVKTAEQKQVYSALSAFVSSMVQSTTLKEHVVSMPAIPNKDEYVAPRKYRPAEQQVTPLELKF